MVEMGSTVLDQQFFRGRKDIGTADSLDNDPADWIAAEDTDWTQLVDAAFRVRLGIQETGGTASNNVQTQLEYQVNGGGFVDVADSNSETDLTGSSGDIRTLTFAVIRSFNAGDKIRFMNSTDDTDLTLVTKTPPAGNGPRIPSVIMSIDKINGVNS